MLLIYVRVQEGLLLIIERVYTVIRPRLTLYLIEGYGVLLAEQLFIAIGLASLL